MKRGFDGIQGLRALAATAVALLHVADEAGALTGTPGQSPYRWIDRLPLEAGVDLFFVISGFVMVWSSWGAFGAARSVGPFVWRRLLRIVPLYWLLTAATVAVAMVAPGAVSDGLRDGWGYIAASFAFVPWRRTDGFVQPVLRLGWTLEYEMLFYGLLACVLPLRRGVALTALLAALGILVGVGQMGAFPSTPLAFWTDPIVLEFALGVSVAVVARAALLLPLPPAGEGRGEGARRRRLGADQPAPQPSPVKDGTARRGVRRSWWVAPLLLMASLVLAGVAPEETPRALVRGVPSALLLFCALSWTGVPRWLVLLGDSSYALYLVHPFPMRAIRVAMLRMHWTDAPLYLATTMAMCVLFAVALHVCLEQPILRWGRTRP